MSRPPKIVAWLLTAHLIALAISAIPSPESLRAARGTRESADDIASAMVRPTLDNAGSLLLSVSDGLYRLTSPVRPLTRRYVGALGLHQTWNMFASPPRGSQYLRFRYFVRNPSARTERIVSEIVYPAVPDGTFRGLRSYWQAHHDKAAANAIEAYYQERDRRRAVGLGEPRESDAALDVALARSFRPLARYYHRRFAASLGGGEEVARSEAWSGWASSPHRGQPRPAESDRMTALARYAAGPVEEAPGVGRHAIDSEEIEADIRWTLLYVQGR